MCDTALAMPPPEILGAPTWIDIPALSVARARDFYAALFGWEYLPSAVAVPAEVMLVIKFPGQNAGLGGAISKVDEKQMSKSNKESTPVVYYHVKCVDEIIEKVQKMGHEVAQEKEPAGPMGWSAIVRDTEGNLVGVYAAKKTDKA
ncbi:MAG: hypothetical protein M1838_002546 [Thelocarpon superellum]|nr:MAG: hypothetical protein M1838_002546 [Thelocarpon superellum]